MLPGLASLSIWYFCLRSRSSAAVEVEKDEGNTRPLCAQMRSGGDEAMFVTVQCKVSFSPTFFLCAGGPAMLILAESVEQKMEVSWLPKICDRNS